MKSFTYERVTSPAQAAAAVAAKPGAKFVAGGTNLLDLMKLQIEEPVHLVDVNRLKLDRIEPTDTGGLRIGALVRNTDLAAVRRRLDLVEREAVDVDQMHRLLDLELHQVEQVGAAGDELGAGLGSDRRRRGRGRLGPLVGKGLHAFAPATSLIASMMLE